MMYNGWKTIALSELMEIIGGGTPKTSIEEYWNGDINWISVKDFNGDSKHILNTEKTITELGLEKSSTKLLQPKDIIISARGTVGELGVIKEPMAFNQSCYGLRAKIGYNADYLYYLLKNCIKALQSNTHGSVFSTITKDTFKQIIVDIPSLQEQKAIANILSSLDEKIELNNQMNKILEEMAQALFKRWFVDFEFPNEDREPYKSSGGEMVDSELGMIPKGWEVEILGNICNVKGGKRLPKGTALITQKNNHPYIRVRDMNNAEYLLLNSDYEYVDDQTQKGIERYIVSEGDVIISIVGTIGLISKVHKSLEGANLTENCVKITNVEQVSAEYVYLWLASKYGQDTIKKVTVGAVQAKLPIKNIQSINTLVPKEDKMMDFQRIVQSLNRQMQNNLEENQILIEERETLLPKLMSGELRVTDL